MIFAWQLTSDSYMAAERLYSRLLPFYAFFPLQTVYVNKCAHQKSPFWVVSASVQVSKQKFLFVFRRLPSTTKHERLF